MGLRVRVPPGAWISVLSVTYRQVGVSATGRSFVQRSHTEGVMCMSVIVKPRQGEGLGPV